MKQLWQEPSFKSLNLWVKTTEKVHKSVSTCTNSCSIFFFPNKSSLHIQGPFHNVSVFFVRVSLRGETGPLNASFQSYEKVNKVNGGSTQQHIPSNTSALYTAWRPHYQVKELLQSLEMWMDSWRAVNKAAPQVQTWALWMASNHNKDNQSW